MKRDNGGKKLVFTEKKGKRRKENSLDCFIRSKANSGRIFTIGGNARFVYLILQLSQRCSRLRSIVKFREAGFKTHGYKDTWLAFLFFFFFFFFPSQPLEHVYTVLCRNRYLHGTRPVVLPAQIIVLYRDMLDNDRYRSFVSACERKHMYHCQDITLSGLPSFRLENYHTIVRSYIQRQMPAIIVDGKIARRYRNKWFRDTLLIDRRLSKF